MNQATFYFAGLLNPPGSPPVARAQSHSRAARQKLSLGVKLILLTILLTFFEGAIRKWVVYRTPSLRYFLYFSKDITFVLAALAGAFATLPRYRSAAASLLTLTLILILGPSLLNIGESNPIGALLSLRAYVILPFCAFFAAGAVRSSRELEVILFVTAVCVCFSAALGCMQFSLPAGHFLNRYEVGTEEVAVTFQYGHVRATGPFSYIAGMGVLGAVAGWAGLYFFLTGGGLWRRWFGIVVIVAGLVCAMVSMSRSGLVAVVAVAFGGVLLYRRAKEAFYFVAIAGVVLLWFMGNPPEEGADPGITGSLVKRIQTADTFGSRLDYTLGNLSSGLLNSPLGEGLGVGQVGGNYAVYGAYSWGGGYESEYGRIAFEVGILGLAGVLLWRIAALVAMWRGMRPLRDPLPRALLAASIAAFAMLATGEMAFNHTGSSFAWAIGSVALGAVALAERSLAGRGFPPGQGAAAPARNRPKTR